MQAMNDEGPTRIERRLSTIAVAVFVAALVLLPLLYVLSAGPAVWLLAHGFLSDAAFTWFYFPLSYVSDRWQSLEAFLEFYLELWGRP
jgi:hypothetical protein